MHAALKRRDSRFTSFACFTLAFCLGLIEVSLAAADLVPVPALGLRVARGFSVTVFADDNLASDIYAMAIDAQSNVVVTSQGYIRTLYDRNDDGIAEAAEDLATTATGGMGLCFDGNDLMFVGDGALWRFRDANDDGRVDGPPERLLSLAFGEHGGHAVRKGPDGAWYVLGGNDTKFDLAQINAASMPGRKIEGGALLRLNADGRGAEVFAHGFRNPYDFDFNPSGDLFTYDSDCERDYFLPWYTPTRIYHVAPGGHHGWRLDGYLRSWARRDYFADTVSILANLDRGSPTGVASYDHRQFPDDYRGGLFALDWTFGRVYFLPLDGQANGATYQAAPEIFLESIGTAGFAPTDIAVGPEGSLYISSGGRKSRGAVYRIDYVAEPARTSLALNWRQLAASELQVVLDAPQPLEAWSRSLWVPIAERLGAEPFALAATDSRATPEQRTRAIEILTELHGSLAPATASACAQANAPLVRARAAWSIGLEPPENFGAVLLGLARDLSPYVRCRALEALRRQAGRLPAVTLQQALAANLAHADKRVRQESALLATALTPPAWNALWAQHQRGGHPQARLTVALAHLWRGESSQVNTAAVETALAVLTQDRSPDLRAQALRLIMLGLGDSHLEKPTVELSTYEAALPLAAHKPLLARLQTLLTGLVPSGNATVDTEAARLLAVIEANDASLPAKLISLINDRTAPTADFHFLIAFSRLKTPAVTNHTAKIAAAVLSLDRKLAGLQQRPKQTWDTRLAELVSALLKNDPRLADAVLRHPEFPRAAHLPLVTLLGGDRYVPAARLFFNAAQRPPNIPWSEPLIDLLSALPAEEIHPLFRRQLTNLALRDRLLIELASKPLLEDRDKFIAALASPRLETVRAAMTALLQLPVEAASTKTHAATLRVLRGLLNSPAEQAARTQALALLTRLTGQTFAIQETPGANLAKLYQPVFDGFGVKYPGLLRQLDSDTPDNPAQWDQLYKAAPWTRGDASRGAAIFHERGCALCHSGSRHAGPDLTGAAQRLAPVDLFNAIVFPSRDVAPAYRMTTYHLRDGQSHTGLMAFESADGVIIHTGMGSTLRLAESDIVNRQPSALSFMPSGLLAGLNPQGLADLYAYLKTLQPAR
jgi:putative membrane-bound dehydrogenase-like protein